MDRGNHAVGAHGQRALSRLGPKDLTQLLKDAFRSERLATELGFRIAEKSDGNPFFAFEIKECRETMLNNVRLHREVMEAWEQLRGEGE